MIFALASPERLPSGMARSTTKLVVLVTVCAEAVKPQVRASAAMVDCRRCGSLTRGWRAGDGLRVGGICFTGAIDLAYSVQSLTSGRPAAQGARGRGAESDSDALSSLCFKLSAHFIGAVARGLITHRPGGVEIGRSTTPMVRRTT